DLFVVIGTSLVVYPAAGLLHYTPRSIPKFIVDRRIPSVSGISHLETIELPATQGIQQLTNMLLRLA
ncbi:MAG: NAD-dependent deacylase, partial [Chitinophagaceae bacterium]|nr:NAD-dependent deacylase [Chitinophagaceae bacterium]